APRAPARRGFGANNTEGPVRSGAFPPPGRYCGPIRHPLASGRLPGVSGYTAGLAPPLSRAGRGGLPQLLGMSLSPCRRYHPAGADRLVSHLRRSVRPSPDDRGLGLRGFHTFGATCAFTLVTARRLAHHPEDGLV